MYLDNINFHTNELFKINIEQGSPNYEKIYKDIMYVVISIYYIKWSFSKSRYD